ncbi:dynamin family protein [Mediterraneibacter glycyrrhizinilyticus]|uniref:dynamin family protein n=1 Tax=Mediterraneibacter glycyrrhizinilyticus TaxID=342942 RepID=UPI0025A3E7FE|nr:dynamin family protein [Mediterraneibacter glycyrrhizinilyticus]MDM8210133.1 dynamin family protein [Mediterraneibacter glycyrrhizinilyticus]
MNIQHRITYDPDEIIRILEKYIDRLKIFRFDSRYRSLLGETFTELLSRWETDILNRKNDPFTLVVCGEFKRGKSSLINALLGEEVVPVNVTTETVTLNRITYGAHSNEAVLQGGRHMHLSDAEMQKENLEKLMRQEKIPFRQIEVKRPIEFLKYAAVIDTPGLGDSMQDFSELVEDALTQADTVLYVFSVNYPLSQTEQLFLKTMIVPQKYTDLLLVGNYLDMLESTKDYERMNNLLVSRIQNLLPDQKPWLVSALDEQCRQMGEQRPNPDMEHELEAHFDRFREKIRQMVEEKKETILPDRMQRLMRGMAAELSESLNALEEGLEMSSQDVQAAMERVQEQKEQQIRTQEEAGQRIDRLLDQSVEECRAWMGELLDKMQQEVKTLTDVPASELSKYYTFYCIDTIQEGMDKCIEHHTLCLYDLLEEISGELSAKLSRTSVNHSYGFRFTMDNHTWTKGDNVSYIVSKIGGMALLSLVADGITGAMRQKEMEKKTPDILDSVYKQYGDLRASVDQAIDSVYGRLGENAKKQLAEYYGEKIRAAQEQVEQSAMVARQDEEHKEEIREAISEIRKILDEIQEELEGMS